MIIRLDLLIERDRRLLRDRSCLKWLPLKDIAICEVLKRIDWQDVSLPKINDACRSKGA